MQCWNALSKPLKHKTPTELATNKFFPRKNVYLDWMLSMTMVQCDSVLYLLCMKQYSMILKPGKLHNVNILHNINYTPVCEWVRSVEKSQLSRGKM